MKKVLWFGLLGLALLLAGYLAYMRMSVNPRVNEQIRNQPESETAARVMILVMPDGRELPVNYLREGNQVYAGADGRWWRAFRDGPTPVSVVIKGQTYTGNATVELEDQAIVDAVFARLRPTVPEWLPDWANGKLVIVELAAGDES